MSMMQMHHATRQLARGESQVQAVCKRRARGNPGPSLRAGAAAAAQDSCQKAGEQTVKVGAFAQSCKKRAKTNLKRKEKAPQENSFLSSPRLFLALFSPFPRCVSPLFPTSSLFLPWRHVFPYSPPPLCPKNGHDAPRQSPRVKVFKRE